MEAYRCEACNRDFATEEALLMHNSAKHYNQIKAKSGSRRNFIFIGIAVLLVIGIFVFFGLRADGNTLIDASGNPTEDLQKITLGFRGNYAPNTLHVREGIPVEITLDNSVQGCYRSFAIPDFGVSQHSQSPPDTITFIPDKKGTFRYRCSMGMGTGTIIVS